MLESHIHDIFSQIGEVLDYVMKGLQKWRFSPIRPFVICPRSSSYSR